MVSGSLIYQTHAPAHTSMSLGQGQSCVYLNCTALGADLALGALASPLHELNRNCLGSCANLTALCAEWSASMPITDRDRLAAENKVANPIEGLPKAIHARYDRGCRG